MGIEKCDFVAKADTREEVMEMSSEHFLEAHPKEAKESMEKMSKEEMDQEMLDKIVEEDDEEDM